MEAARSASSHGSSASSRGWWLLLAPLSLVLACERLAPEAGKPEPPILVFAASSLGEIVERAAEDFEATSGVEVRVHVAGTSTIGRQVLAGARADVFIAADRAWAEAVLAGHPSAVDVGDLAGNRLVLVGGSEADDSIDLGVPAPPEDWSRLAIADPAHVPAGRYARQSLESMGWWTSLEPRLVPTADVRAALRLVELGEADAGVVYETDVAASTGLGTLATIPSDLHDPIVYPVIRLDDRPEVLDFVERLWNPDFRDVLRRRGFTMSPVPKVETR
ncbi:MAG: molybdate ABC transporter substrate-binding protein [Phycisphaerales bacterium]|nr:molybdate ABC transporter substrate-binding protein [Phycisphaerales bacterium]MDG1979594.1 molybdate ABC transporter substrate-binding protein [Phycisphaerales bacterium]MDG2133087.1 molybdate ABC transporter substrate-binding protein [Phycisphaerales bacterium]